MKVMQCWDDGVSGDVRLVSLLRRHGARATFNLNAALHERDRRFGWHHRGTEVWRLGRGELRETYDGFSIANHTLTHPHLERLPIDLAKREIRDGRARLQDLFAPLPLSGARLLAALRSCKADRRILVLGPLLRARRRRHVDGLRGVCRAPVRRAWRAVV